MNNAQEGTMDNRKTVLKVEHVAKSFRLPMEQASGLKQAVINWTKGISGYKMQHVLRDINFEVKEGGFLWRCRSKRKRKIDTVEVDFGHLYAGSRFNLC